MLGLLRKHDGRGIGLIIGGGLFMVASFLLAHGYNPRADFLFNLKIMELDFSNCSRYFNQSERGDNPGELLDPDGFFEWLECKEGIYIPLRYFLLIGISSIGVGVYVRMTDLK